MTASPPPSPDKRPEDPSFTARITPSTIHRGTGVTGRYTKLGDALVEIEGMEQRRRTVMCFGDANAAVTRRLAAGRPVSLECRWRGRGLLVVGWPRGEKRS